MSLTKLENLINPEVMGDMISAGVLENLKFAPLAEIGTALKGNAGDTVSLPKYAYIGDAEDLAEGEEVDITQLTATSATVTVKKVAKATEISDESVLSGYGDPVEEAALQLSKSIEKKIDADVFASLAGIGAGMTVDESTKELSGATIASGLVKFGEDLEDTMILYVAPEQLSQLRKDANFIEASKLDGSLITGAIGSIWGCQIVVSNRIKAVSDVFTNYIVKPGAFGIELKADTNVETDRDITKLTTVIVASKHYAAYLKNDYKAIKLKTKA